MLEPATGDQLAWQEGASGEAVYTTFDREATPALRFRSADDMMIYKAMSVFPSAIRDVVETFADATEPYVRVFKDHADQVRFDASIAIELEAAAGVDRATWDDLAPIASTTTSDAACTRPGRRRRAGRCPFDDPDSSCRRPVQSSTARSP